MNGLLVIDKPGGMTSRDVVNRVQKWFPRRTKIGHTGTLDPLATGVLVVCVGAATRLAAFVQAMGKTYRSRFRFGATSTTDDADGEVTSNEAAVPPTRDQIEAALPSFVGNIEQIPPAFSALKVAGQRAHMLARKGKDVSLAARTVRVDAIRVLAYEWPWLDVEIDCGKGTYIRSIARDLGAKLDCGGMVETLRRTRIGPFYATDGLDLAAALEEAQARLLPLSAAVAGLPQIRLSADQVGRFRSGQLVRVADDELPPPPDCPSVGAFNLDGQLVGIASRRESNINPEIVFNV
jgi:tRNA pseudouridine55 synthase